MNDIPLTIESLREKRAAYERGIVEMKQYAAKLERDIIATSGAIQVLAKLIEEMEPTKTADPTP
jgi:hypothetical protein